MNTSSTQDSGGDAMREGPSIVTGHLLAYAELATAMFQAWQRSLQQRLVGAALVAGGLAFGVPLLTFGVIAVAWPTDYRWAVLFGIAGLYLLAAAFGVWMLLKPSPVAEPGRVFLDELRKDAQLLSAAWRERAT